MKTSGRVQAWRVFAVALALTSDALASQVATLEVDIETARSTGDSRIRDLTTIGGKVVFRINSSGSEPEQWTTDGTAFGTRLLADSCAGECSSSQALEALGLLFWEVRSEAPTNTVRLWRTDGTVSGTFALTEEGIRTRFDGAAIAGNRVFFPVPSSSSGPGIWMTDGTPAGTRLVTALDPSPSSSGPGPLTAFGDQLYFFTGHSRDGLSLWRIDALSAVTTRLQTFPEHRGLAVGFSSHQPFFLLRRDRFPFSHELWTALATGEGLRKVGNINISGTEFLPARFISGGSRVFLLGANRDDQYQLWASDGTEPGTHQLTNDTRLELVSSETIRRLGEAVYFFGRDAAGDRELWRSEGTPGTTRRVLDICPGPCPAIPFGADLEVTANRLFFPAFDGSSGMELWSSDGRANGTRRVSNLCPGTCGAIGNLSSRANHLFFQVLDHDSRFSSLWYVSTESGTARRLTRPGNYALDFSASEPALATEANGELYFVARDAVHGAELWRSDGSETTSSLIIDLTTLAPSSNPCHFNGTVRATVFFECEPSGASFRGAHALAGPSQDRRHTRLPREPSREFEYIASNGLVYFVELFGKQLWRTDGTSEGTIQLTSFDLQGEVSRSGPMFVALGNDVYFDVRLGFSGRGDREIWRTDGSPEGTGPALNLTDAGIGFHGAPTAWGERMLFSADDTVRISDGTSAGTVALHTHPENTLSHNTRFYPVGELAYYFAGSEDCCDLELWRTDGTPAGTAPIRAFNEGSDIRATAQESRLVFSFSTGLHRSLWSTDGSEAGTIRLARVGSSNGALEPFNGRVVFAVTNADAGDELWVTDGTVEGTHPLLETAPHLPQIARLSESSLRAAGSTLYFAADDGIHGNELWRTDGTPEGTRLAHDLAPGPASSDPEELTVIGEELYLSADDGLHGREPWSLQLAPENDACPENVFGICLENRRFRVDLDWRDQKGQPARARTGRLTDDTGYFFFFNPNNVETVLKVLDGTTLNDHFWVFSGALSNVEYHVTITDVATGAARRYYNPPGRFASLADTGAFGPDGASGTSASQPSDELFEFHAAPLPVLSTVARGASGTCAPSATRLCLAEGRFAVEIRWTNFAGTSGSGNAAVITGDTGYFWFFREDNVEVVTKIVDGTALNGHFWFFYGALSTVEYTIEITDTVTGTMRSYRNASGRLASVGDTGAF